MVLKRQSSKQGCNEEGNVLEAQGRSFPTLEHSVPEQETASNRASGVSTLRRNVRNSLKQAQAALEAEGSAGEQPAVFAMSV